MYLTMVSAAKPALNPADQQNLQFRLSCPAMSIALVCRLTTRTTNEKTCSAAPVRSLDGMEVRVLAALILVCSTVEPVEDARPLGRMVISPTSLDIHLPAPTQ